MNDLSDIRRRAWKTRRATYGQRGHAGTYSRSSNDALLMLAIRLMNEGVLSEGQVSKAANLTRVQVRTLAQKERESK